MIAVQVTAEAARRRRRPPGTHGGTPGPPRSVQADRPEEWAAVPLSARTLATTRLAEHWAHALDVTGPLDLDYPDTARLRNIAWLAHRTLPYAFATAGGLEPLVQRDRAQVLEELVLAAVAAIQAAVQAVGGPYVSCTSGRPGRPKPWL
jgi:hypothetical protein